MVNLILNEYLEHYIYYKIFCTVFKIYPCMNKVLHITLYEQ